MKKGDDPIVVEQTYAAPVRAVWNALTDPSEMRQWYFDNIESFEPVVGFETEFDVRNEERLFPHQWKVVSAEPERLIAYGFKFGGYPGDSLVTFELAESEDGSGTRLKLCHEFLESFPQDVPEFQRDSCAGGWKYFLKESLKAYLESAE